MDEWECNEQYDDVNEEEMYVEFAFMEVNDLINRYGIDFFLSRIAHDHLINLVKAIL